MIHVSASAKPGGDGSAARPFSSIHSAIAAAAPRSAIKVQQGAYTGETIQLKENVDLYGGFGPNWQRDVQRYATILDGKKQRRIMIAANNARIDGFVFLHGSVRGRGAAVLCDGTSPHISNNTFTGNMTLASEGWNPKQIHEMANDGGAVSVARGGAPVIDGNLFARNGTEAGRGGALAYNTRSAGTLSNNVFLENTAGWRDPKRSSDGGAVSIFEWSRPTVTGNLFIGNRALGSNDAGGLFVALWSSPRVERNIFVSNYGDDDAGGLFVGGQEHRYDTPLDPFPPATQFDVHVVGNVFSGNANRSANSGAFRITMESRALVGNNIIADNLGGAYFQRSEIRALNNTIVNNTRFVETKEGIRPGVMANNIIYGEFLVEAPLSITFSNMRAPYEGKGNISGPPGFVEDGQQIAVDGAVYDPARFLTTIKTPAAGNLANRLVSVGTRWSVIHSSTANAITVWGDFSAERSLKIAPTYRLAAGSPCIDAGDNQNAMPADIVGTRRPAGKAADMGAYEYKP